MFKKRLACASGFTLVELLVVIAIIGVLVALLLPAVQAAREAARRVQCVNHLKQMGLGALNHESTLEILPAAGYAPWTTGDADRGTGLKQPGSWIYQLLPYVEQQNIYDLPGDGDPNVISNPQRDNAKIMEQTPIAMFNCPSRRAAVNYPWDINVPALFRVKNSKVTDEMAHSDYAANAGDGFPDIELNPGVNGPPFYFTDAECEGNYQAGNFSDVFPPLISGGKYNDAFCWPSLDTQNGVCFLGVEMKLSYITDGTSNTMLFGEKYIEPSKYELGTDPGDNQCMYSGWDWSVNRWGGGSRIDPTVINPDLDTIPSQDQVGRENFRTWGSSHPGVYNAVYCDGSVTSISFDADPAVLANICNRFDGQTATSVD